MREILFRGKRIDNGEWVEGSLLYDSENKESYIAESFEDKAAYIRKVTPKTVGQYTGLKDKNGKRIFEGDIIKYAFQLDYNCYLESLERPEDYEGCDYSDIFTIDKVIYCCEWGYPAFDLDKQPFDCNSLAELSESMEYYFEVIGNIHDNPELLEVTNDR